MVWVSARAVAEAAVRARSLASRLYGYAVEIDREAYHPLDPWLAARSVARPKLFEAVVKLREAAKALEELAEALEKELPRLVERELAEQRARELLEEARRQLAGDGGAEQSLKAEAEALRREGRVELEV